MKKKFYWLFLAVCSVMVLSSCNDDDDDIRVSDVPEVVLNGFQTKYPGIVPEWENKLGYYVAEFWQEGIQLDVWISSQGEWSMTEMDLGTNQTLLPQAVLTAFQNSTYAAWLIDDMDKYERPDRTFFLIEVETAGQPDHDLYYTPDGTLLKDEVDTENNDVTPATSF